MKYFFVALTLCCGCSKEPLTFEDIGIADSDAVENVAIPNVGTHLINTFTSFISTNEINSDSILLDLDKFNLDQLKVGDIIASDLDYFDSDHFYIKRVTSIKMDGNQMEILTEDATLSDAYEYLYYELDNYAKGKSYAIRVKMNDGKITRFSKTVSIK